MTERAWTAIRINYHDPDKAALLAGAIGPIVNDLLDYGGKRALFRPHWRFGPHAVFAIELAAQASPAIFPRQVREQITKWIEDNPSSATIDPITYLTSSQKRGKAEGIEGPYLPIAPNNTLTEQPDAIDLHAVGSLAEITLDFHASALPLLVELARLKPGQDAMWVRLAEVFACAASLAGPAGISGGHLSFRSHAEGFLSGAPPLRPRFEAFSARFATVVDPRITAIDAVLKADPTGRTLGPGLMEWFAVLLKVKAALDAHVDALTPEELELHSPGSPDRNQGTFEKMVLNGALKHLRGNRQFIAYRLLLSSLYGLLPTIGVKPVERFALCYLVAESGSRIYGVDWQKHLSGGGGQAGWLMGVMARLARWRGIIARSN